MIMATVNVPLISLPDSIKNGQQHPQLVSSLPEQCGSLKQLNQVHGRMLRTGLFFDAYAASKLITAAALAPYSSIEYARKVFDQIPQPNLYTWNTLIRGYASSEDPDEGILTFLRMLHDSPEYPNKFTYPFVIKAASESSRSALGNAVHGMVIKAMLHEDVFILNSLVHLYGSCGKLDSAYQLFVNIPTKDVVSWNSIITVFSQAGRPKEALELFKEMEAENVKPNDITLVGVLSACAKKLDLKQGRWVCSYIERNEINMNLPLSNAVLDMYMKCGSVEDAKYLFDKMPEKDIVSWTTMLDGYAKSGNIDEARRIFSSIPEKTVASWNALISAYEQNGKPKEALACFHELQASKTAKPDEITWVSALSACAQLGAVDLGGWIQVYLKKHNLKLTCQITTSLIDMYAKCGDLQKAFEVFSSTRKKDVFIWTSMIGGFAMHRRGREAIDLFLKMHDEQVRPSSVTYTNLLCACSHSGLVEEGRFYFNQMERIHGIVRGTKHYACMVDLLGRAGLLEEAVELIEKMPIAPSASIWVALLGACKIHGNVEIAEWACNKLLGLEPSNDGAYVMLSNIYAKAGNWVGVSRLRKLMREQGINKERGCSSIEVDGTIHEFLVGDNAHPMGSEIYKKVEEIAARLKAVGYVPNKSRVLQFVEEDDMKEQALNLHSEKLAIAFGLISTEPTKPIRVVKNLRVCVDCHAVAKLVSELYGREILLRDQYRFHRFRGGICSCGDYW